MDPENQASSLLAPTVHNLASIKVFPLIPTLKRDITNTIDSALSWDQLTAADINFSIVRPIVNKYARLRNMAVVYACLVVRSYFLSESESDLAFSGVMTARANLCEILAMKLLSRFAHNYIQLVAVLTTTWNPLVGASSSVVEDVKQALNAHDDDMDSAQSAIEMAISTSAKNFLASPVTQQVVNDIYSGRVVFSVTAQRSILADNYKPRAIEMYNPHNAPFINHYRLRVPKYRTYLDFLNFTLLLFTFVLCLANRDRERLTFWEVAFMILGGAFALEEYTASTEHGWIIYIASMWNAFDFAFIAVFLAYFGMRVHGLRIGDLAMCDMAFDVLACGACILFPRLAFLAVSNKLIVLSLRAMIVQFVFFISIAAICFSGLLFTLWTLGEAHSFKLPYNNRPFNSPPFAASDNPVGTTQWTLKSIAWLMVQIWFGNTYLSFAQAASFHPLFGPILMTMFAALANTLLLTILISILSNTVARIDGNATQEYLFQYTIITIEGVKSDALFSYQPPFNILAFVILKPLSYMLTPRRLHSTNVFLIKLTSLPQLLLIGFYERFLSSGQKLRETGKGAAQTIFHSLPRHIKHMPFVEALVGSSTGDLYEAIFDVCDDGEYSIFNDEGEDEAGPALRSIDSRENVATGAASGRGARSRSRSVAPRIRTLRPTSVERQSIINDSNKAGTGMATGTGTGTGTTTPTSPSQARQRATSTMAPATPIQSTSGGNLNALSPPDSLSVVLTTERSPLMRLFGSRFSSQSRGFPPSASNESNNSNSGGGGLSVQTQNLAAAAQAQAQVAAQAAMSTEASVRNIEALLETVGQLPVHKLKEEMKELQDRQARIENLLLMLTRGMRNEASTSTTPHRQGTMS
ncbi:hypothetical protein CVT25_013932 [Psilocybe cyanescens]|uniref:Ion transport domain-containing protein n=1 Tax=Psilocybe cyanescens TaxID=93625 RepID=A0A409XJS3_PSICY|nr:hypothetical protein CVT25_013932 [Psilocybe cyanescens]